MSQVGRNAACPCGSGKKYKQCCGKNQSGPAPVIDIAGGLQLAFQSYRAGNLPHAEAILQQLLKASPNHPDALNLAGIVALELRQPLLAVERLRLAIKARPKAAPFHCNLGNALRAAGRDDQAIACYEQAVRLDPAYARGYNNLGIALNHAGRQSEAEKRFRQSVSREPGFAEGWANLGNLLLENGQPETAIPCLEKAIHLAPGMAEAYSTLGSALDYFLEQLQRALECHEHALRYLPSHEMAHWRYGFALLKAGNLELGWAEYVHRFLADPVIFRNFPQPSWQGEVLSGKTLLIWGEQGVGDEILFAEPVRDAILAGARVWVECDPRLVPLFARSWPEARVVARANPPSPELLTNEIDLQTPAGNLARWLRPEVASFSSEGGFLLPDPKRVKHWSDWLATLGGGIRLGISWRSMRRNTERNNYYTELTQWGDILGVKGVTFVNLQYGDCEDELREAEALFGVTIHRAPELDLKDDLDDAAALTRALDLVIGPKTSVTAMAGAVGVPTWLLNLDSDWTMLGTDRMPWFPSVEVFAKSWEQPWAPVLSEVAARLDGAARNCP